MRASAGTLPITLRIRRAAAALRLARYFGTTPQFWLGLQAD